MRFPDPELADPQGILAVGGDLNVETLIEAYSRGIFPWPQENVPLLWFSPPERGVLFFDKLHVPKSVEKLVGKKPFKMTMNKDFVSVIKNCSKIPRKGETGTWIIPEMVGAYEELFKQKLALSVEAWDGEELVGGLYGVFINGIFSGESMFFKKSGASKLCLLYLIDHLKSEGLSWIDTQMVTPVVEQFGGEYIPRKKFLAMLKGTC